MEFKAEIAKIADRARDSRKHIANEEATKTALVLPMLMALGYDIFNPTEVVPELSCDMVKSKGERIDYAIMLNGGPAMLVECKDWREDLALHNVQLQRYFVASDARIGVLTNGIRYQFFTDTDKTNIMDTTPFLDINILDLRDGDIDALARFSRKDIDVDKIAADAAYTRRYAAVTAAVEEELKSPSQQFVKLIAARIGMTSKLTESQKSQLLTMIRKAIKTSLGKAEEQATENCNDIKDYSLTDAEKGVVELITNNIAKSVGDNHNLICDKLSNGELRFCYINRWWNVCRIKIGERTSYVKICHDASVARGERVDLSSAADIKSHLDRIRIAYDETIKHRQKWLDEHHAQ